MVIKSFAFKNKNAKSISIFISIFIYIRKVIFSCLVSMCINIPVITHWHTEDVPLGRQVNPEQHSIGVVQLAAGQHIAPEAAHVEGAVVVVFVVVVAVHPLGLTS